MASTVLGACRHIPTIARVSTAARQSMCASLQCASGSATSASVSSKRSLHSTSLLQKEAGPVEQKLQEQVTTLAADAARKIDPAVLKKEPSPKIDQIADMICALNMIEAMQLSESLKRKLGLPDNFNVFARGVPGGAAAPAAAAAAPAAAAAAPAAAPKAEEKATVSIRYLMRSWCAAWGHAGLYSWGCGPCPMRCDWLSPPRTEYRCLSGSRTLHTKDARGAPAHPQNDTHSYALLVRRLTSS